MIRSFGDSLTEDLYNGTRSARTRRIPQNLIPSILRKLDMLHAAYELKDLRVPPGNHLEGLKRDLAGFYSIRVNDQWRIVFKWVDHYAEDVKLVDYH